MAYGSPLPVQQAPGSSGWHRDTVEGVPAASEQVIMDFEAGPGGDYADHLSMTGTWPAEFRLYLGADHKETRRTEAAVPVATVDFTPGFRLEEGQHLVVKVLHYDQGQLHDFEASLKTHR